MPKFIKGTANHIIRMNAKGLQDKGMSESDAYSKAINHAHKDKPSFKGKIGKITKKVTKSKPSFEAEDDIGS